MKEPDNKCYTYALKYISRYPKTQSELKTKLLEKGFYEDKVDETIDFLKYRNLVDDENFVRLYVHSEIEKKGKPSFKIQQKLRQKGIDKNTIYKVFDEQEEEMKVGMTAKIIKEIDKMKNKGIEGIEIIQKLMTKGYNLGLIKEVVKNRAEDSIE